MPIKNTLRSALLVTAGAGALALSLTACGSGSGVSLGGADAETDFFDQGQVGVTNGFSYDDSSEAQESVEKGLLPAALPKTATKIEVEYSDDKTFASWRGPQAQIDSCKPSTVEVPKAPSGVGHKGTVADVTECGDVFQATVGEYSYYWGAITE